MHAIGRAVNCLDWHVAQLLTTKQAKTIPRMVFRLLEPWPKGVASYHKLRTCGNLRLRLATACVDLRWLVITSVHFDRALKFARKRTQ